MLGSHFPYIGATTKEIRLLRNCYYGKEDHPQVLNMEVQHGKSWIVGEQTQRHSA